MPFIVCQSKDTDFFCIKVPVLVYFGHFYEDTFAKGNGYSCRFLRYRNFIILKISKLKNK
jgi:hypothetical protein